MPRFRSGQRSAAEPQKKVKRQKAFAPARVASRVKEMLKMKIAPQNFMKPNELPHFHDELLKEKEIGVKNRFIGSSVYPWIGTSAHRIIGLSKSTPCSADGSMKR